MRNDPQFPASLPSLPDAGVAGVRRLPPVLLPAVCRWTMRMLRRYGVSELRWPETTIHGLESVFAAQEDAGTWRPPGLHLQPAAQPFRTCWYCGSIHLGDLYAAMQQHPIRLDVADRKYGWPHKAYVHGIPNPHAGRQVLIGNRTELGVISGIFGDAPPETVAKVYFDHLAEVADAHAFQALTDAIAARTGVRFALDDGGQLRWHWAVLR